MNTQQQWPGDKQVEKEKEPSPWLTLLFSIGFAGLTYYIFTDLQNGGSVRVPWFIYLAYEFLGLWGGTAVMGLISLALFVVGVKGIIDKFKPA